MSNTSANSSFTGLQNEESVSHAEDVEQQARQSDSTTSVTASVPGASATSHSRVPSEEESRIAREVALEDSTAMARLAERLAQDRMNDAEYTRLTAALRLVSQHGDQVHASAVRCLRRAPAMSRDDWRERRRERRHHHDTDNASLSSSDSLDDSLEVQRQQPQTQSSRARQDEEAAAEPATLGNASTSSSSVRRSRAARPPPLLPCCDERDTVPLVEPPSLVTSLAHPLAASTALHVVGVAEQKQEVPVAVDPGAPDGSPGSARPARKRLRLNIGGGSGAEPAQLPSSSSPATTTTAASTSAVPARGGRMLSLSVRNAPAVTASEPAAPAQPPTRRTLSLVAHSASPKEATPTTLAHSNAAAASPNAAGSPSMQLDSIATVSTTAPFSSPRGCGYGSGGGGGGGGGGGTAGSGVERHISVISSPFSPGTPGWPGLTPTGPIGGGAEVAFPTFANAATSRSHTSLLDDDDDLLGDRAVRDAHSARELTLNEDEETSAEADQKNGRHKHDARGQDHIRIQAQQQQQQQQTSASRGAEGYRQNAQAVRGPAPARSARSPLSPTTRAMLESESPYGSLTPTPAVYGSNPARQHSQARVPLPAAPLPIRFDTVKVHVQDHYIFRKKISEGTYGEVYVGVDKRTNEVVALKRLKTLKALDGFPLTSLREVIALKHIERQRERWRAAHRSKSDPLPEIITLREVLLSGVEPNTTSTASPTDSDNNNNNNNTGPQETTSAPSHQTHDIYLVFSYASCSLAGLLEKRFAFTMLELTFLFHKIILGVRKLHEMGIIHRDIKADNILLTDAAGVQLADFGLCAFASSGKRALTPSMINLSYRPPEMLLGSNAYDERVDVWSIGCLLAQVFLGVPPFFKRRSATEQAAVQQHNRSSQTELEQLGLICEILGPLPREGVFDPATCKHLDDLQKLRVAFEASGGTATPALQPLFEKSFLNKEYGGFRGWFTARVEDRRRQVERLPADRRVPVLMPTDSCLDALSSIFQLDSRRRPTAAELLKHKFFQFLSSSEEVQIREGLASRLKPFHGSHIAPR